MTNEKNKAEWYFPLNDGGMLNGISDSGIETFKGNPAGSLAREICQNSLDARISADKPVIVQFEQFVIQKDKIPGFRTLKRALADAYKFWKDENPNKKAEEFLLKAKNVLNEKEILCLRISDFNTTGLTGSDIELNSAWNNLVKSQGTSDKSGSNGGAFGIGKYASFALSNLRTVFYVTRDENELSASEGVVRLPSFKFNGKMVQGYGFYGIDKNRPIMKQLKLDPNFPGRKGKDYGTDIFIIGFDAMSLS